MSKMGEIIIVQCLDKIAELLKTPWWDIFSALATPLIALMVAYVAFRQYKIEEAKLRRETYSEKLKIYKRTIAYASEVIRESIKDESKITDFYKEVSEVNFLCGKKANAHIEKLYEKSFDLWELEIKKEELRVKSPRSSAEDKEYADVLKQRGDLKKWFIKQPQTTSDIFKKEMSLVTDYFWSNIFNKNS